MARVAGQLEAGFATLEGGVNSSVAAAIIQPNQVSRAQNVTFRGGYARTRPKFDGVPITWADEEFETWCNSHAVQGKCYYKNPSGDALIVASVGGRIFSFRYRGYDFLAQELTPSTGRNSQYLPHAWFQQAGPYLIVQDGQSRPIIINGASSRRSNIMANEVPVGRQMAFVNGRLAVVLNDKRSIAFGDLYGVTTTSVLEFTEIAGAPEDGGGVFSIPVEAGEITGCVVTAQTDTAAGQGILLVSTDSAVCSFNPVFQRSQWANIQFQSVALIGSGFSSDGLAVVNGDVWGRSTDGIRSFIMARREFTGWGNTPQSREIQSTLEADTPFLLDFSDAVYFDNRLIMTVSPLGYLGSGCYHRGLAVLNFDGISTLRSKTEPAWEGIWNGIQPFGLVVGRFAGEERCFALAFNSGFEIWEITKTYGADDDTTRIQAFVETRSFDYGSVLIKKQMQAAEFAADQMLGTIDFTFLFRPDQYPCWQDWAAHSECWTDRTCDNDVIGACITVGNYSAGYTPKQNLPKASGDCNVAVDAPTTIFYSIQFRLEWVGQARIRWFQSFSMPRDQTSNLSC